MGGLPAGWSSGMQHPSREEACFCCCADTSHAPLLLPAAALTRCTPQPLSLLLQVQDQLGLASQAAQRRGPPSPMKGPTPGGRPGNRFILPLAECEFVISAAVEELQRDAFPAVPEHRPSRCTGTALQVRQAGVGVGGGLVCVWGRHVWGCAAVQGRSRFGQSLPQGGTVAGAYTFSRWQ